ncbi:peptidase M1 [Rhodonellum psychrophilum GCM71 = DSM 17998]|uniref:Peptidase M1 n=2 Tax=Rhodonellum TaxID=336827 RepID=U5C2B1_9BACT|nr:MULTISPECIES: M1 family metallopeptidase [Rhodonellum]ERM83929.1 peptidase M1 [Rhodonellum psychrophilum GCM71 = DSM 17998]SDZ05055.1 Peptidase family M1 [Rhodonellum ikkaensis]
MIKKFWMPVWVIVLTGLFTAASAQADRWQQKVIYEMDVTMDVVKNQYKGTQKLHYTNNSPDTLERVFYHLFNNAFQPNSMMDVRSRTIADPDRRVGERIKNLGPEEIGSLEITTLKMNGKPVRFEHVETILEVDLVDPILPGSTVVFDMDFEGQAPLQVRRSGRDNAEGIRYSMAQWYPKMAAYDRRGWHANPYIGREFYGNFGDFDVKITIDKTYILGGTGYLQNANEIGYGYEDKGVKVKPVSGATHTWHFIAPNVHDFVWAADPKYTHEKVQMENGPMVHFLYVKSEKTEENWSKLKGYTTAAIQYMSEHSGKYPYDQYSVIQGGDGGMEYPMATLITGNRNLRSLVGVTVHELIHSWYYGVLGFNESSEPWLDEGFTTWGTSVVMDAVFEKDPGFVQEGNYRSYFRLAKSGNEEPLTTHGDHYNLNSAYGAATYTKGAVFIEQMTYLIGKENFDKAMLRLWNEWKFKHPTGIDVVRVMEKESGLELDWFYDYFIGSTKTIDYGVKAVEADGNNTKITLERIGLMPMPLDVVVTYQDGSQEMVYMPLVIQRGSKPEEAGKPKRILTQRWPWTDYSTEVSIGRPISDIKSVEIDPSMRLADINRENNKQEVSVDIPKK